MTSNSSRPRIFMLDLLAIVPYYTAYLSRALLQEGANLRVGSISYYLDPECFRARGVPLHPGLLDVVGRYPLPKLPRRILKLAEALINLVALSIRFLLRPPDVIHVQYLAMIRWPLPLDLWFIRLFQNRGTRIVLTVHDLLPHDTAQRYLRIFKNLYAGVDQIICHSDHIATKLVSEFDVTASKISVIPHGPFFYDINVRDPETILNSFDLNPGHVLFLCQGILFPYKGVDLLLRAWERVEQETPNAQLLIAGTGSPELLEQLRRQAESSGLKRVRLHFHFISTDQLVALYQVADVVVYPYRAITTSGALATGLSFGKTIVASDLPVFRELLTDGESASLVDPQNTDQLASALAKLAEDPELRARFAQQIRDLRFGDQTWHSIAQATIATYQKALAAHPDLPA